MSVPNHFFIVERVYDAGTYDLTTRAAQARFVDDVVVALHAYDPRWGHLRKMPGQTHLHHHAEDAALYRWPTGTAGYPDGAAQAVDFIGGAGGAHPVLQWSPDPVAYYTDADWLDPVDHERAPTPTPPIAPPYPGDQVWDAVGATLFADYAEAGQAPNARMGRWFGRVMYDWLAQHEPTLDASLAKHRAEWRALLGLPPSVPEP